MDMEKAKEIRPGDLMMTRIPDQMYDIPYRWGADFWDDCKRNIRIEPNTIFTVLEYIPWVPTTGKNYFQLKILYENNIWYMAFGPQECSHLYWEWWPGKWEEFYKRLEENKKRKELENV